MLHNLFGRYVVLKVIGLSSLQHGFDSKLVHVEFLVDQVAIGQVFLRVHRFYPVSVIPLLLHALFHSSLTDYVILAIDNVTK
jgi:hypothetical protein